MRAYAFNEIPIVFGLHLVCHIHNSIQLSCVNSRANVRVVHFLRIFFPSNYYYLPYTTYIYNQEINKYSDYQRIEFETENQNLRFFFFFLFFFYNKIQLIWIFCLWQLSKKYLFFVFQKNERYYHQILI